MTRSTSSHRHNTNKNTTPTLPHTNTTLSTVPTLPANHKHTPTPTAHQPQADTYTPTSLTPTHTIPTYKHAHRAATPYIPTSGHTLPCKTSTHTGPPTPTHTSARRHPHPFKHSMHISVRTSAPSHSPTLIKHAHTKPHSCTHAVVPRPWSYSTPQSSPGQPAVC